MKYVLALIIFLTSSIANAREELKVGVVLHLTGDLAMQSNAFLEGIQLAVDEINAEGKLAKELKLIVEDGHNSSSASHTAARKLVNFDKVDVAIISSYLDAMAGGRVFEKAKIPAITLWDSNPEMEAIGDYLFAIGPWLPSSGQLAAKYSKENFGAKTAVVVMSQDPFSEGANKSFGEAFTKQGGTVLTSEVANADQSDFRALISKIKRLNPDVIYAPLVHQIVPFYKQLHQLGVNIPTVSCDIISDEHIRAAPHAFEGIYHTMLNSPSSPEFQSMAQRYQEKFGKEVTLDWFVAVGYDSVRLIENAIDRSDATSEVIKDGLYKVRNFPGASTSLTINERGSAPQHESMYRIVGGEFLPQDRM